MQSDRPNSLSTDNRHADALGGELVLDAATLSALEELAGEDDPALVNDLVELFLDDADKRMGQVEKGLAEGDFGAIAGASHALKSSSANVGALPFSAACAAVERMSREPESVDPSDFEALVRRAAALYDDVRKAFNQAEQGA